jgi:hypothetical protein
VREILLHGLREREQTESERSRTEVHRLLGRDGEEDSILASCTSVQCSLRRLYLRCGRSKVQSVAPSRAVSLAVVWE